MQATSGASQHDTGSIFTPQLIPFFLAGFLYVMGVFLPPPLIVGFCGQLGGGGVWMGLAAGIFYVTGVATRPFAGYVADRVDKRNLAFFGLLGMVLGIFGVAAAGSVAQVVLFRALGGIGYSFCSVAFSSSMVALAPRGKVGTALGFYSILQAVAMAIGPTLGLQLSARAGYRGAFAVSGIISLIGVAVTLKCVSISPAEGSRERKLSFVAVEVLPLSMNVMLGIVPYSATTAFLSTVLQDRGVDMDVSWYFIFVAALVLVLRTALSKTYDTWRYRTFIFIAAPSTVAALVFLQFARQPWQLILSALLMAAGYAIMLPVTQTKSVSLVTKARQGLANSTYYIGVDMGGAVGSMLAGGVYQYFGAGRVFIAFLICPLLVLAIVFLFRRQLNREPELD